jgi:hypothetical protein
MEFDLSVRAIRRTFLLFLAQTSLAFAVQPALAYTRPAGIVHQYPLTGSREVPPATDIGIRAIGAYDAGALAKQTFVAVGSKSGAHTLAAHLTRDRSMIIFHSATPFAYGETVQFAMNATLIGGTPITDSIHFTTMIRPITAAEIAMGHKEMSQSEMPPLEPKSMVQPLGQPSGVLPPMTVTIDDSATPGTIYFANLGFDSLSRLNNCYLFNCDRHGVITRQRELPYGDDGNDFKMQPNGLLTYDDATLAAFVGMDSAWNVIDTFAAKDYPTDLHDLRFFPDGSYALLGDSYTLVNMTDSVAGGKDSELVEGEVIQKFDKDGSLVFQWRGIDHYTITDSKYINLTSSPVDFEHANALDFDSAGNFILSNRHLCEISKINGVTGDFMWRLGGAHNQFTLVGDSIWFSFQHGARLIPNGDLTVFDNANNDTVTGGNGTIVHRSRAVEYAIDTTAKTATLVWQYHHTPETVSTALGYVERLPNGNTLICWGADDSVAMTEVRPDNTTAFELVMGNDNYSYRAIKFLPDSTSGTAQVASASVAGGTTLEIDAGTSGALSALYTLGQSQLVTLTVYDMTGREVRTVLASQMEASGTHEAALDLAGLPDGAYECALITPQATIVRSFCFLK